MKLGISVINENEQEEFQTCLLPLDDVKKITGLGTTTIYRYMKNGKFPKSKKMSRRCVRWRRDEIIEWLKSD